MIGLEWHRASTIGWGGQSRCRHTIDGGFGITGSKQQLYTAKEKESVEASS